MLKSKRLLEKKVQESQHPLSECRVGNSVELER